MMRRDQHLSQVVTNRKQWRRRIVRQRILSVVACLIVFCMTYALILPALANRDASAVTTSTNETTTAKTPENVVSAIQTEPKEDWESIFADANLTGVWREDLLSIAQSQLGYIESARNFIIAEDGETTKGYTYYGDWYGDPYGDWDAMFVSFCLNYAGIEDMPLDADPQAMVEILDVTEKEVEEALESGKKAPTDYYYTVKEYAPIAGDLIFFDTTGDGLADRVGIVTDISLDGTQISTVEGDSNNKVQNNTYEAADSTILGYGTLPAQPVTYTYTASGLTVKVSLPQGTTVPADAVLSVKSILSGSEGYDALAEQANEAVEGKIANLRLFDISFYTADDNTYIPVDDDAKVTISFGEPVAESKSSEVVVLHYDDKDENPVVLADTEIADQATENAEVKFETAGFSTFAVVEVVAKEVEILGDPQPPYSDTVTNILTPDQINAGLGGMTLMISSEANGTIGTYAVTNTVQVIDGKNQLAATQVTSANGQVTVGEVNFNSALWLFEAVGATEAANDYYIKAAGADGYLNVAEGTASTSSNAQALYVVTQGNYVFIQNEPGNEEDGRICLSYNAGNPITFSAYNDVPAYADHLILSVPTVETTKIPNVDDGTYNDLDNRTFVISNYNADDGKYYALTLEIDDNGVENLGKTPITKDANGNIIYLNQDYPNQEDYTKALWVFEPTNTEGVYNIRPYNSKKYLKISNDNGTHDGLVFNGTASSNTNITVFRENNVGFVALRRTNQDNPKFHLIYDPQTDSFTADRDTDNDGFPNAGGVERASMVLTEYMLQQKPTGEKYNAVTNLDGQKLAIVSPRAMQAVTPNDATTNDYTDARAGTAVTWVTQYETINVPNGQIANVYWTFTAVDAANGVYNISTTVNGQTQYLNIGHQTATLGDAQNITVITETYGGLEYIGFRVGNDYLNDYGDNDGTFAGWNANMNGDAGARFILARERVFEAIVMSREEYRYYPMMEGNKVIIFTRQKDANGTYRYYAVDTDGKPVEIYLEGDTLAKSSTMYVSSSSLEAGYDTDKLLWDGHNSAVGGWSADNNPADHIDMQFVNVQSERYFVPNDSNGDGSSNAFSVTSPEGDPNQPVLWGEHVTAFTAVNANDHVDLDTGIASMITTNISRGLYITGYEDTEQTKPIYVDGTRRLYYDYKDGTFNIEDVSNVNGPKPANGITEDKSNIFYMAVIKPLDEQPTEDKTNLEGTIKDMTGASVTAKILTRHELNDAAKLDQAQLIFFVEVEGKYYALDANGDAMEISVSNLAAGEKITFSGIDGYNTNRLLWDGTYTKFDPYDESVSVKGHDNWIDLTLRSVAYDQYLSPRLIGTEEDWLVPLIPVGGQHTPGFFTIDDYGGRSGDYGLASYLAALYGTTDNNGKITGNATRYKVIYQNDQFKIVNGWESDQGNTGNLTGLTGAGKNAFYAALLIDINNDEYTTVTPAKENVTMYLFNYGSAIDQYGKQWNKTLEASDATGRDNPFNDKALLFRFFYRAAFLGEAIDGTNEKVSEYAEADYFNSTENKEKLNLLLNDGYPAYSVEADVTPSGLFSLQYLFDPDSFKASEANRNIYETPDNGSMDIDLITNDGFRSGTEINSNGDGTTPIAGDYNPVLNPNYAVNSFKVGNGTTTGLFQQNENGFYYYDSKLNAAYFNGTTFDLYDYVIYPTDSDTLEGGNFLPFNLGHEEGHRVYDGRGGAPVLGLPKNETMFQLNGVHHDTDVTIGRDSMTDMWFGLTMEIEFNMTKDGKIEVKDPGTGYIAYYDDTKEGVWYWIDEVGQEVYSKGTDGKFTYVGRYTDRNTAEDTVVFSETTLKQVRNDLVFNFAGDDDVFVYVDDVLLLDISGIHGVVDGEINFSEGTVTKRGVVPEETIAGVFAKAGKTFNNAEGSLHTLKFFYLERGGNISDCAITFNLEALDTGSLTITKEVEGLDENDAIVDTDGKSWSYEGDYIFELFDVVQPYDSTRVDTDGVIKEVGYRILSANGSIVKDDLVLNLVPQTVYMSLPMKDGSSEAHEFELCRVYLNLEDYNQLSPISLEDLKDSYAGTDNPNGYLTDPNFYYTIYRYDDNGTIYFYNDYDGDGKYEKQEQSSTEQAYSMKFFKVFKSADQIVLKNGQTADFDDFILNTLLKVRELPATNGVQLGTSYWWRISGEGQTEGVQLGVRDDQNAMVSNYFKIEGDTNVDVICRNVLQPVNLGIRKELLDHDGTVSGLVESFKIKYTLTYPTSDYYKWYVEYTDDGKLLFYDETLENRIGYYDAESGKFIDDEGNFAVDGDRNPITVGFVKPTDDADAGKLYGMVLNADGTFEIGELIRETYTEEWTLVNKPKEFIDVDGDGKIDESGMYGYVYNDPTKPFYPSYVKGVLDGSENRPTNDPNDVKTVDYEANYYQLFMWTTMIPFGSNVTIEEITADGYDVTWAYEGWGNRKVAVNVKDGKILTDEEVKEINATLEDGTLKYLVAYDAVRNVTVVINDFVDSTGKEYNVGDVYCIGDAASNISAPYHYEDRYVLVNEAEGKGSKTSTIKLTTEDNYITIYNTPGYELPATGGAGTTNLYALGVLLVIAAPLLYIGCRLKRKCERGAER